MEREEDARERSADSADVPATEERATERCRQELTETLGKAEERKVRARRRPEESIWFGLGTFGLVGWSVAVPTLLGLALGLWLDGRFPGAPSWTLTLLFAGIVLGCINAWYWVSREREEIERRRDEPDDD